jgi:NACalpha-BTF3-like transcription factor
MFGVTKEEYRELTREHFKIEDTLPLSPLPRLEELMGATLCAIGKYKCFPWKGEICTFVNGKLKKVKNREQLWNDKLRETPQNAFKKSESKKDYIEIENDDIVLPGAVNSEDIEEEKEKDALKEENINLASNSCTKECYYNKQGHCSFNSLGSKPHICDDPFLEKQRIEAKSAMDLI